VIKAEFSASLLQPVFSVTCSFRNQFNLIADVVLKKPFLLYIYIYFCGLFDLRKVQYKRFYLKSKSFVTL